MIYYVVYKITNLINGKVYIGVHETQDMNDDYYGSGTSIKAAIRKYGKQNFIKEVLSSHSSRAEMFEEEAKIVTEDFIKQSSNYNNTIGGKLPPNHKGKNHPPRSEESKKRYKEAAAKRDKDYGFRIAKIKKEKGDYERHREVARQIGLGNKNTKRTEEQKQKIGNRSKNSRWFTNGTINKFIHIDDTVPAGFQAGKTHKNKKF
jgi:hypothetical protein